MIESITPEQASGRWCPMVQIAISPMGDIFTNRMTQWSENHCIADRCACWKWTKKTGLTTVGNVESEGHCGLIRH